VPGDLSKKVDGNGLGLSISYNILKKHGQTLKVESTPGEGSRVYFNIPFVPQTGTLENKAN
jgi:two-component system sensor histidine kinase/response regulator